MKKTLKNFLIAMVLTFIIFFVIYIFFSVYDSSGDAINRFKENINYIIFLYCSIIFGYIFYISSFKLSKIILGIIVFSNFFVASWIFFNGQIGFGFVEFLILFGVLSLSVLTTLIKNPIRYVFFSITGIAFLILLLFSVLPIYDKPLNLQDFSDNNEIFLEIESLENLSEKSYVLLKTDNFEKKIPIQNGKTTVFRNSNFFEDLQISFVADKIYENSNAFLVLNNGTIFLLKPQSQIDILNTGNSYVWDNKAGEIYYFVPEEIIKENGNIYVEMSGEVKNNEKIFENQIRNFENEKKDFIILNAGGKFVLNPTIDLLIKNYITILNNINSKKYAQNMINYNQFQQHLEIQSRIYKYEKDEKNAIKEDINLQTENAINQTKFLKTIYNRFK